MFGFANALLLALFAAAGVDLVLALRRKAALLQPSRFAACQLALVELFAARDEEDSFE